MVRRVTHGRHIWKWNKQGFIGDRATPLQHFNLDTANRRPDAQTQRSRGGLARARHRAHEPEPGFGTLGRKIQASERLGTNMALPKDHGATTAIFQYLFRRPQGIAGTRGTHPQQPAGIDTPDLERQ